MIDKEIYLDGIDPVTFFGVNNVNYEVLRKHFLKIKLVARGARIKAIGDDTEVEKFEEKINLIRNYIIKYNSLPKDKLKGLLAEDGDNMLSNKEESNDILLYGSTGKAIRSRSVNQQKMVDESRANDLLFSIGPAGTGKTYLAIALAVKALKEKQVKRIILSRPAVEAGEHLGFLPGDLKEKLDPYLQPLYDALLDMIPAKKLADLLEDGFIQIAPLAFMRGRTLSNAFVILDEAQNSTANQLKMFLTRMGENSKFVVTGDITQIDLPDKKSSGLVISQKILKNIEGISYIYFDQKDIIRHRLVSSIVSAYSKYENDK